MTALKRPNIPFMVGKQATNVKLHSNFKYKRKLVEILKNVLQKQKQAQLQNINVSGGVCRVTEMNTFTSESKMERQTLISTGATKEQDQWKTLAIRRSKIKQAKFSFLSYNMCDQSRTRRVRTKKSISSNSLVFLDTISSCK